MSNIASVDNAVTSVVNDTVATVGDTVASVDNSVTSVVNDTVAAAGDTVASVDNAVTSVVNDTVAAAGDTVSSVESAVTSVVNDTVAAVDNTVSAVENTVTSVVNDTVAAVDNAVSTVGNTVTSVANDTVAAVDNVVSSVETAVTSVVNDTVAAVGDTVSSVGSAVTSVVNDTVAAVDNTVSAVENTVTSVVNDTVAAVGDTVSSVGNAVTSVVNDTVATVGDSVSAVENTVTSVVNDTVAAVGDTVSSVGNAVTSVVNDTVATVGDTVSTAVNSVVSVVNDTVAAVENTVTAVVNDTVATVDNTVSTAVNSVVSVVNDTVANAVDTVSSVVNDTIATVVDTVVAVANETVATAVDAVTSVANDTVATAVDAVTSIVNDTVAAVANTVNSAVNDTIDFEVFSNFLLFVAAVGNTVTSVVNDTVSAVSDGIATVSTIVNTVVNETIAVVNETAGAVSAAVNETASAVNNVTATIDNTVCKSSVTNAVNSSVTAIVDVATSAVANASTTIANGVNTVTAVVNETTATVVTLSDSLVSLDPELFESLMNSSDSAKLLTALSNSVTDSILKKNVHFCAKANAVDAVTSIANDKVAAVANTVNSAVNDTIDFEVFSNFLLFVAAVGNTVTSVVNDTVSAVSDGIATVSTIVNTVVNETIAVVNETAGAVSAAVNETASSVNNVTATIDNTVCKSSVTNAVNSSVTAIVDVATSAVANASTTIANGVNTVTAVVNETTATVVTLSDSLVSLDPELFESLMNSSDSAKLLTALSNSVTDRLSSITDVSALKGILENPGGLELLKNLGVSVFTDGILELINGTLDDSIVLEGLLGFFLRAKAEDIFTCPDDGSYILNLGPLVDFSTVQCGNAEVPCVDYILNANASVTTRKCVKATQICDGYRDCSDGSDEGLLCHNSFQVCPKINDTVKTPGMEGHFVCKMSGNCIDRLKECDCYADCSDESDLESLCNDTIHAALPPGARTDNCTDEESTNARFYGVDPLDIEEIIKRSQTGDLSDVQLVVTPSADNIERYGTRAEDFILSCSIDGNICSYKDFFKWQSHEYGNCFTYNSPYLRYQDNDTTSFDDVYTTSHYGATNGLKLILNVESEEYLSSFTPDVGVRVVVHSNNQIPFPEDSGIDIAPGYTTAIGVKKKVINRASYPYGVCHGSEWDYNGDYSKIACDKACIEFQVRTVCKCSSLLSPLFDDHNVTGESRLIPRYKCYNKIWESYKTGELECPCDPSCSDEEYLSTVSQSEQNKRFSYMLARIKRYYVAPEFCQSDPNKMSTVRLKIYVASTAVETIEESPMYTWENLIANIGGIWGFYLGFSAVTVLETFEFFGYLFPFFCKKCKQSRKNNKAARKSSDCESDDKNVAPSNGVQKPQNKGLLYPLPPALASTGVFGMDLKPVVYNPPPNASNLNVQSAAESVDNVNETREKPPMKRVASPAWTDPFDF
ncbi:unnamed protein product [Notodromas monacha]|uniref:Uncharacterized protein n=1 Tax=Notodromas monacha TaxID=399045 RepID=A0A7R9GGS6_9CRUS|nr:unnamed protein product [Notodromas monacha]CAG0920530.1 unnamed protein product [Notodromas monacha]